MDAGHTPSPAAKTRAAKEVFCGQFLYILGVIF
jgi:hypothetical protein